MLAMLIFEAVLLLLGVASYASTSADFIIRSRSKRDLVTPAGSIIWSAQLPGSEGKLLAIPYTGATPADLLQAGTTVHTIPALDATPGPTYSPYQRQASKAPGAEHRNRKNFPPPNLQSGFQASQHQTLPNRVPQNNYKNSPSSYLPQPSSHFQNNSPNKGKSQYFQSPSSYKLSSEPSKAQLRSGLFPIAGSTLPTFSQFKSPATITGSNSGDHFSHTPGKHHSNSGSSFHPHSTNRPNSSSLKHSSYPAPRNVDAHPPFVQTSPEIAGYIREFENDPVVLNPGFDYQAHPSSSGFSYDHSKSHPTPLPTATNSFSSNLGNYKPRLSPIQSPRSTPQIPQFQAASINEYSGHQHNKPLNGYEQLIKQPQLHFTTGAPGLSVDNTQPIVYHSNPFEQIRTDVELINKKKTTTASPFGSDENDFDEAFKTNEGDFGDSSAGTDSSNQRPLKSQIRDNSFELPSSNLFSSYDEAFGKYSKLASVEQGNAEKGEPLKVDVTTKPVYQSIEDDDSDDGGDKSSGEYRSSYSEGKDTSGSYEDEDEEESRRNERHGNFDEKEARDDDDEDAEEESSPFKGYGEDFEKEFEESYKQELPKDDYVHVKEVPEIEEPRSESKKQWTKRPRTNVSRVGIKQKTRYTARDDYKKPKKYETHQQTHEYEPPESSYRDNEGHGTRTSYKSAKINDPPLKDTYGYKIPRDRGTARFRKKAEKPKEEKSTKKSINDVQDHSKEPARFSATTQTPLTSTFVSIEDLQSYTFPPFGGWKPGKKLVTDQDSYGASRQQVRAIFNPENPAVDPFPQSHQGALMYLSNGQIVRDLSGI